MSPFTGRVAVVTGAGSGIGRAVALELARRGARLAVSDVNDPGLAQTVDGIRALGAEAHAAHVDVADRAAVITHAAAVADHYGVVHQIYNNAGISGGGQTVLETEWEVYDHVLAVNLFGVINGTKALLPYLIASGAGHVVNVSSLNGYLAQPTLSAYCASKFGVRGFTEALRAEMLHAGHPVRVSVVHPGGVRTNIAGASADLARDLGVELTEAQKSRLHVYNTKLLRMPAEKAARIIVDGVRAGKPRIRVGTDAKAVDLLARLAPGRYPRLAVMLERRMFGAAPVHDGGGRTPSGT